MILDDENASLAYRTTMRSDLTTRSATKCQSGWLMVNGKRPALNEAHRKKASNLVQEWGGIHALY